MSKLEERESRRRSAVGKFVEQTPMLFIRCTINIC